MGKWTGFTDTAVYIYIHAVYYIHTPQTALLSNGARPSKEEVEDAVNRCLEYGLC